MNRINVVTNGKYKSYKVETNPSNRTVTLVKNNNRIDLTNNLKSATMFGGDENSYEIELKNENVKLKCKLEFATYLCLVLFGIGVSKSCIGLK